MKLSKDNPQTNSLNPGITDIDVENAIKKSGYPLQTIIANKLRQKFYCQEEWSFIDRKTKEIRSIDIMAQKELYDFEKKQPRVRPILNLIIECKQSELPYVFFLSPEKLKTSNYPNISGLFHQSITLSTNDDPSTWTFPLIDALGLSDDSFIIDIAPCSLTFSKCVRSGKDIVLSGTESFQSLVMPLLTSLLHFGESEAPPKTAMYFDGHLPFAIGILDAPMIGVTVKEKSHDSELIPWIRIFRHESYESEDWTERKKMFAIDIVHKDYFDTFIDKHLLPFAKKYADLILKHDTKIAAGKAFAKKLGENSLTNIEERLEKHSITKKRVLPKL
jgi:hypothetical protein